MVRLVFRPYTQILWSICTSESLRASTRVSPGFTLFRHSSPSFGSQHVCSHSDRSPEGLRPADFASHCHFHCAPGFATPVLAHMLDSLVRVSRREKQNHFVPQSQNRHSKPSAHSNPAQQHWPQRPTRKREGKYDTACTGLVRFLFSKFRYSLTLFSKFFASFPHGTCALSVSHQYLAFDGIYHHLFCNPKQNYSLLPTQKAQRTGVSPSQLPSSKGLGRAHNVGKPQFGKPILIASYFRFTRRYAGNPG